MKTIIAATDFTPSSLNASMYAALLSQKLNCKLTIFNLFETPLLHSNSGLYGVSYQNSKTQSELKSKNLIEQLKKEFPKVKMNYFVTSGAFNEELENFTQHHLVEACVMGLKAKDKLTKFLSGSHGVNIAGKINTPVIIVPDTYKNHVLCNATLAVDNNEKIYKASLLQPERFAKQLKLNLTAVYVRTEAELFKPMQNRILLNGDLLQITTIEAKDIERGLKKFSKENSTDLIMILSKTHSVFYNLFSETNTRKIAYSMKVPVMALHD